MNGQVAAKLTYPEWLRRQSAKTQDLALGVHRARLFRANPTMDLSKLGDAFRQPLTLSQLAVREAQLAGALSLLGPGVRRRARRYRPGRLRLLFGQAAPGRSGQRRSS